MPEQENSSAAKARVTAKKVRGTVFINENRCKACGFCIEFCPPRVLEFSGQYNAQGYRPPRLVNAEGCTGCDLCGLYCPDFAIYGVILKQFRPSVVGKPTPTGEART